MTPVTVIPGSSPLILSQPHSGTWLPDDVRAALKEDARGLIDTDWHVPELYDGLAGDATIVRAHFSRSVIDANRPPDAAPLSPGQNTTGLVPVRSDEGRVGKECVTTGRTQWSRNSTKNKNKRLQT